MDEISQSANVAKAERMFRMAHAERLNASSKMVNQQASPEQGKLQRLSLGGDKQPQHE